VSARARLLACLSRLLTRVIHPVLHAVGGFLDEFLQLRACLAGLAGTAIMMRDNEIIFSLLGF
jgi:hypothetical protein